MKNLSKYESMRLSVLDLADRLSWDNVAIRHARAYEKICSLWGVYSSSATGAFSGVTGEPVDFMSQVSLASSTGSEVDELVQMTDELPPIPTPEEFDRMKMLQEIDDMEAREDD